MKRFIFLVILFSIFIFPKNAFAKSFEAKPQEVIIYTDDDNDTPRVNAFDYERINGLNFYTFRTNHNVKKMDYYLNFPDDVLGKSFNYSTYFWLPNFALGSIDNYNTFYTTPIIDLNGTVCDVKATSSYLPTGVTWSQVFAVRCNNVVLDDNRGFLQVITPSTNADVGLSNNRYGIHVVSYYSENAAIEGILEETKKQTEEIKKQTETIKDSDTSEAGDSANSFFGDFKSDDYGLSDIVTMPLSFINGLSSGECNSLILPMPFVEQNVELPCMTSIYNKYFKSFLQLYQIITTGFIAYWICINIFRMVQNFKNPDNDEVEVLDL